MRATLARELPFGVNAIGSAASSRSGLSFGVGIARRKERSLGLFALPVWLLDLIGCFAS